jgi:hypothetical protein
MPTKVKKVATQSNQVKTVLDAEQSKILTTELSEAFVTFRTQLTLLTQTLTALLAGNIAYLGYAYSTQKSIVVMSGASFPIIMVVILDRVRKWMIPIIYSAIVIENRSVGREMGVVTNFIAFVQGQKYVDQLLAIGDETDLGKRRVELRKMALPMGDKGITRIVCITGAIAELVFGIILWRVFKWSLF